MTDPAPPSSPLHYADDARHHRRHHRNRKIAVALLILSACAVLAAWLPKAYTRVQLLRLQRQCMEYQLPPGTVVLDTRPSAKPDLVRSDPEIRAFTTYVDARGVGRVPALATALLSGLRTGFSNVVAVPFMHRLRSPGGNERLVIVCVDDGVLLWLVIEPATFRTDTASVRSKTMGGAIDGADGITSRQSLTDVVIYAGTVDPNHPDHFTIPVTLQGRPFVIDAWLRDDDVIEYQRLSTSASNP